MTLKLRWATERQVLQSHESQPATRNPLLLPPPPPQSGTGERRGNKRTLRKQAEDGGGDESPGGSSQEWEPYSAASPASRAVALPLATAGCIWKGSRPERPGLITVLLPIEISTPFELWSLREEAVSSQQEWRLDPRKHSWGQERDPRLSSLESAQHGESPCP